MLVKCPFLPQRDTWVWKRLTRFYRNPSHQTNKPPSAAAELAVGDIKVSRAPAAAEQPAPPLGLAAPRFTEQTKLEAALVIFKKKQRQESGIGTYI